MTKAFQEKEFKDQAAAIKHLERFDFSTVDNIIEPKANITEGGWITKMIVWPGSDFDWLGQILTITIHVKEGKTLPETAEKEYFVQYKLSE